MLYLSSVRSSKYEPNVLHIVAGKSRNCYLLAKVQNLIKTCGWWWLVLAGGGGAELGHSIDCYWNLHTGVKQNKSIIHQTSHHSHRLSWSPALRHGVDIYSFSHISREKFDECSWYLLCSASKVPMYILDLLFIKLFMFRSLQ